MYVNKPNELVAVQKFETRSEALFHFQNLRKDKRYVQVVDLLTLKVFYDNVFNVHITIELDAEIVGSPFSHNTGSPLSSNERITLGAAGKLLKTIRELLN